MSEMQCYGNDLKCENTISYRHKDDWHSEEDYMCEDCLEKIE